MGIWHEIDEGLPQNLERVFVTDGRGNINTANFYEVAWRRDRISLGVDHRGNPIYQDGGMKKFRNVFANFQSLFGNVLNSDDVLLWASESDVEALFHSGLERNK